MYHPTTLSLLAQDRRSRLEHEAANERRVREARAATRAAEHREPRERFSVRDLRWLLFRPTGA
ncbi:MAG TPA: hypothetical protein VD763_13935 [Candidatus Saccharimonadales bacterium]|nr:hypothetical protein [Candidatus Saccharimonadales bacterium]